MMSFVIVPLAILLAAVLIYWVFAAILSTGSRKTELKSCVVWDSKEGAAVILSDRDHIPDRLKKSPVVH